MIAKYGRRVNRGLVLLLVFVVLISSFESVPSMPFWERPGLDFQNLHAFQNCQGEDGKKLSGEAVYRTPGANCGDWGKRPMLYPPPLFHSFWWTQGMSIQAALAVWLGVLGLSMGAAYIVWIMSAMAAHSWVTLLFWVLLGLQAPFVFELERANTNAPLVPLAGLAALALTRMRFLSAGLILGTVALLKLYPAFFTLTAGAGLLGRSVRGRSWHGVVLLVGGGMLSALLLVAPWYDQWIVYVTETLPAFSQENSGISHFSHSLNGFSAYGHWLPYLLRAALLGSWLWVAFWFKDVPMLSLCAGGLAISTYFAGTSYDYNLVSTFPLLTLMCARVCRDEVEPDRMPAKSGIALWGRGLWLCVGIIALLWNRTVFGPFLPKEVLLSAVEWHLLLQVVWLTGTAWLVRKVL